MSKVFKISDVTPDVNNFNLHTPYGMQLLEKSLDEVGIIESITVSAEGEIISGNARHEIIGRKFDKQPIVVETSGDTPIIIKRTDIHSNTAQFTKAALLANTTATKNINLDLDKIEEIAVEEFGLAVEEFGVDLIDGFGTKNKEINTEEIDSHMTIVLKYTESEFFVVKEQLYKVALTPEAAVWKLLGNE